MAQLAVAPSLEAKMVVELELHYMVANFGNPILDWIASNLGRGWNQQFGHTIPKSTILFREVGLTVDEDAIMVVRWWRNASHLLLLLMESKFGVQVLKLVGFEMSLELCLHHLREAVELTRNDLGGQ